jgi:hypothetical protein
MPEKKKYNLDLWKLLQNADENNLTYYDELTDVERPEFQPLIIARWMSGVPDDNKNAEYYMDAVNQIVNEYTFSLAKYPDLLWRLIASCGAGKKQRHVWIKGPSKLITNKLDQLILGLNPSLSDMELELVKRNFTRDKLVHLCRGLAMEDSEINKIVEEFKKYKQGRE